MPEFYQNILCYPPESLSYSSIVLRMIWSPNPEFSEHNTSRRSPWHTCTGRLRIKSMTPLYSCWEPCAGTTCSPGSLSTLAAAHGWERGPALSFRRPFGCAQWAWLGSLLEVTAQIHVSCTPGVIGHIRGLPPRALSDWHLYQQILTGQATGSQTFCFTNVTMPVF